MIKENEKILTPLVSLDTPGKATVEVVILADPVRIRTFSYCSQVKLFAINNVNMIVFFSGWS